MIIIRLLALGRRVDWILIGGMTLLLIAGLLMQYSISLSVTGVGGSSGFSRQLAYVVVGLAAFLFFSFIDQRIVRLRPVWWWLIGVAILVLVLLFGKTVKGTTGWFVVGGMSIQPVEFAKLFFILFIAHYCEESIARMREWKYAMLTGVAAAIYVLLILGQPDLGSSAIVFFLWLSMVAVLRAPKLLTLSAVVAVVTFGFLGWFFLFEEYQKDRLAVFINPEAYAQEAGYNVIQSKVAIGSGAIWGRGLGFGTQSQLHFLPEVSTDFVFAAFAEEFGFVGVITLLTALGIVLFRLWLYMKRTRDVYVFTLCLGAMLYLLIQSTMNIGMNLGVLPVTGVPLPLVSAGGSSLLMTLILLGMVHHQYISGRTQKQLFSERNSSF